MNDATLVVENAAAAGATPDDGHTHESRCLNCGTTLVGSHCHACGQMAHVHRTLSAFLHDLLHGVFHVEGKIWRTLPLLAWHPGRLTREYIDGRRASYVSPMALFLFSVFLFFASVHSFGGGEVHLNSSADTIATAAGEMEQELAALEARRPSLRDAAQREALDKEIAEKRADLEKLKVFNGIASGKGDVGVVSDIPLIAKGIGVFRANPDLALYKLQSSAYKYSWLLIPISIPLMWLLFPFSRRFHAYDHTVFVTFSLSFMTLLVTLVSVLVALGVSGAPLLLLYAPLHMYRDLRGTYLLSRRGAFWRTCALTILTSLALVLFAGLILSLQMT